VVMEPSPVITAEHIRRELAGRDVMAKDARAEVSVGTTIDEMERRLILNTLNHTAGNKEEAARILKVSSRTLRNKLARYAGV